MLFLVILLFSFFFLLPFLFFFFFFLLTQDNTSHCCVLMRDQFIVCWVYNTAQKHIPHFPSKETQDILICTITQYRDSNYPFLPCSECDYYSCVILRATSTKESALHKFVLAVDKWSFPGIKLRFLRTLLIESLNAVVNICIYSSR